MLQKLFLGSWHNILIEYCLPKFYLRTPNISSFSFYSLTSLGWMSLPCYTYTLVNSGDLNYWSSISSTVYLTEETKQSFWQSSFVFFSGFIFFPHHFCEAISWSVVLNSLLPLYSLSKRINLVLSFNQQLYLGDTQISVLSSKRTKTYFSLLSIFSLSCPIIALNSTNQWNTISYFQQKSGHKFGLFHQWYLHLSDSSV